jgi:hypothetical protein
MFCYFICYYGIILIKYDQVEKHPNDTVYPFNDKEFPGWRQNQIFIIILGFGLLT